MLITALIALLFTSVAIAQSSKSIMFNHISFQGTNHTIEADDRCVDLDGSLMNRIESIQIGFKAHCEFFYLYNCMNYKADYTRDQARFYDSPSVLSIRCGHTRSKQLGRTKSKEPKEGL
ncbi:hypothetical protein BGZ61DRAFT_447113 [Ilyonectria robusta]|uniref:uncharacterized protein n=1 Tax=Ilyonectria robusta TaxID=1079257 RepID=UPI001E8E12B4|nr:uncharacterized protein BGZ61DRAFT_447113 [Ilyonectria robusta]KAH8729883.1 hypothetical protein BGZ61DRAFT_447113 [Ilyonectria robusta]